MPETAVYHETLASIDATELAHQCNVQGCSGGFRWLAWSELESAAKYALNTGLLPQEAATMLHAALYKLDLLNKTRP
jgi:hypothetical protein